MAAPLLEFYQQHAIAPVRQDISDLAAHFARRATLYRSLGIPPALIRGRLVLDIGPGTGENALYIASLKPARYVLVEPNPTGAAALRALAPLSRSGRERWEIHEEPIEDFESSAPFDVVLCEGVLGLCGTDPRPILEAIVRHVPVGGVLVLTCIDPISDHAEILRRALAQQIVNRALPLMDQVAQLRPIFAPHLATLTGMTRSVDDWILDNLLNPASIGPTFSIPDACDALDGDFELLGCSPRCLSDWRWYKQAPPGLQWVREVYWANAHNLLDYRDVLPAWPENQNRDLMAACLAYREQERAFEAGTATAPDTTLLDPAWFGRGQQYLSFERTHKRATLPR